MRSLSSPRRDMDSPDLPVRVVRDDLPFRAASIAVYKLRRRRFVFVSSWDALFLTCGLCGSFLFAWATPWLLWQGRLQPLQAVDEKSVVAQLKQQLEVGNLRPTFLYQEVATRIISEEEMIRRD
jgi:hypothetical protein